MKRVRCLISRQPSYLESVWLPYASSSMLLTSLQTGSMICVAITRIPLLKWFGWREPYWLIIYISEKPKCARSCTDIEKTHSLILIVLHLVWSFTPVRSG